MIDAVNHFTLGYFVALDAIYTLLLVLGTLQVRDWVLRRPLRDFRAVAQSPMSFPVTIIAPCYNEGPVIVDAIASHLRSRYRELEVLVVNDGSTDGTLDALRAAFDLVEIERVPHVGLASKPVHAIYMSRVDPRLTVVDKENGGKADALNCGIRYATSPLFCAIDCDTLLDPDALSRLVWAFQADPRTVANGGIVRISNGSLASGGRLTKIHTPRNPLVNVQIVEYLRAFLCGRAGWSKLQMLLVISGAFGLFHRETVVAAGGYDTTTVGEDAELIVRLHRHCRDAKRDYRISFLADPICWTEAPDGPATLGRQRDRWQRGLLELLWRHREMLLNPRYGRVGMIAMPYMLVFEAIGPVIEMLGLVWVATGLIGGWLSLGTTALFVGVAYSYGLILSFGALLVEQRAFRRYPGWRDLARLAGASVIENLVYRQWMTFVRAAAFWTVFMRRHTWGAMPRRGLRAVAADAPERLLEPERHDDVAVGVA